MITVNNVGKWYGDRVLFEGAQFQLNSGERYGLIGANGSGKTTLLNIFTGDVEATEGSISMPKGLRLGTLKQDQFLYRDERILDVCNIRTMPVAIEAHQPALRGRRAGRKDAKACGTTMTG